jgi:hypothetical protein
LCVLSRQCQRRGQDQQENDETSPFHRDTAA